MEITKIKVWTKVVKGNTIDHVRIAYNEGETETVVHKFGEDAIAAPEFYADIENLSPYVCKCCGISDDLKTAINVRDISIKPSEDKEGNETTQYTMDCSLKSGHATSSIKVSIQHKFIPEGFEDAVLSLINEAEEYVNGKRQQTELFDDSEEKYNAE